MSIKSVVFNGAAFLSAGLSLAYSRPYATVNLAGTAVSVNDVYYESPQLYLAPPASVTQISATSTTGGVNAICGSGTWSDGTPATLQQFSTAGSKTAAWYMALRVNAALTAGAWDTFTGARVKDIHVDANGVDLLSGSGATYGEDNANVRHDPTNGVIEKGLAVVCGVARRVASWTSMGGSFWSGWNDSAPRWELLYRSPPYNSASTSCGGDFTRPKVCYLDDPATATEAFLVDCDYMTDNAGNTLAGIVKLARLYRTTPSDVFEVDQVVELVRLDYDTTAAGGGTGTHIHDVIVVPWGNGGMAVIVVVGHQLTHSTHMFTRADRLYATGWSVTGGSVTRSTPTGGASTVCDPATVTTPASKTDGTTQNGWTTRRYAFGDLSTYVAATHNAFFNPQYMSLDRVGTTATALATSDEAFGPFQVLSVPAANTDKLQAARCVDGGPTSFRSGYTTWGIVRPNQSSYSDYLSPRMVDNVTALDPPNFSGTNWKNRIQAGKWMYSPDGTYWGAAYHPGTDLTAKSFKAGWHGGTMIVGLNNGSAHVLRAVPRPSYVVRRPLVTSPAVVNYARFATSFGSAGGTNAAPQDVTGSYQAGLVTGQGTIPACPCNGKVVRVVCTDDSTVTVCAEIRPNGGSSVSVPIASKMLKMRWWVYRLPPAIPFVDNAHAPFNTASAPYFAIKCTDNQGAPVTGTWNAPLNGGRLDAQGWYPIDFDIDVSGTTELSAAMGGTLYRAYLRFQTAGSTPGNLGDWLIACETVTAGATSDWATVPPPQAAGADTTTESDACSVDGWAAGANWSWVGHFQVSPRGWDCYCKNSRRPTSRRICTLYQSPTRYISVAYDPDNARIVVTNGTDTINLTAATGELFEPGRGDNITVAVTATTGGTGGVRVAAAVGGSSINSATATWSVDVRPTRIVLADTGVAAVEGMMHHGMWMDTANDLGSSLPSYMTALGTTLDPPSSVVRRRPIPVDVL